MNAVADEDTKISTGIEELDRLLEGGERRELYVFVGAPAKRAPTTWDELMERIESRRPPDFMPEPGS
jgi:hypothetical protein